MYVSRGGLKLERVLKEFGISVKDKICLDVGASTGGFTDCLLQHGAKQVYALDVGYGLIDWKLRKDPRVVMIERTNIRNFSSNIKFDLTTIDVSFISLTKVLPKVSGEVIALIKPQFEAKRDQVPRGGIVIDPEIHKEVIEKISKCAVDLGFKVKWIAESPISGIKGNKEFFIWIKKLQ